MDTLAFPWRWLKVQRTGSGNPSLLFLALNKLHQALVLSADGGSGTHAQVSSIISAGNRVVERRMQSANPRSV